MNIRDYTTKEDRVWSELTGLLESCGYERFKMRKFEEYSLYLKNKNFSDGEYVLTFTDPNGKLLAFKPDVTLSIVKNSKASANKREKVYYRESVYRYDKHRHEYREIDQIGLEVLGKVDEVLQSEVMLLAARSLETVSKEFVLDFSHTGYLEGLLEWAEKAENGRERLIGYVSAKNAHDLNKLLLECGADEKIIRAAVDALSGVNGVDGAIRSLIASGDAHFVTAAEQLQKVVELMAATGYGDNLRADFSVISDVEYYSGVIFRGYVRGVPHAVLSGGRYDKLAEKFGKAGIGGMGFALYLSDLCAYFREDYRKDKGLCILLYDEQENPIDVMRQAEKWRKEGYRVRQETQVPQDCNAQRIEKTEGRKSC